MENLINHDVYTGTTLHHWKYLNSTVTPVSEALLPMLLGLFIVTFDSNSTTEMNLRCTKERIITCNEDLSTVQLRLVSYTKSKVLRFLAFYLYLWSKFEKKALCLIGTHSNLLSVQMVNDLLPHLFASSSISVLLNSRKINITPEKGKLPL